MAVNSTDTIGPPTGMGTDIPPADLPKNFCQYAKGVVPGRNGKLALAPLIKRLAKSLGVTIYGTAFWQSEAGIGDRLLVISSTTVYSILLSSNTLSSVPWKIDELEDGPHSYYSLGSVSTVATHGQSAAIANGTYSIQFGAELIISIAGVLFRYYVDTDGVGSEHWYSLGMPTGGVPTLTPTTGGSMTAGQTYSYEYTWVDELGRESSPSPAATATLGGAQNAVIVTQGSGGGTINLYGGTYWNIYRLNPGATLFKFVAQVAVGTTTYTDNFADSVINANQSAPTDGENDPPIAGGANMFAVWKDRLVLNSLADANLVQVSNANSPVQFSSLPLPTNLDDGLQINVGGHGQNQVTGLGNLGSLLAIFGRETTSLLYGDDISSFTLRETLQRGCQNANSVQRCENEIFFLSDDGIYAIGYEQGYAVTKRSIPIDDIFRGFTWVRDDSEPTSHWRYQSAQVTNAITVNVNSFYSDNRYYLSIGNRTLVMDIRTGGWTDTGWGFIKTACVYMSQQTQIYTTVAVGNLTSAPETVFLTFGDPTAWGTEIYYFTNADTPTDRDSPPTAQCEIVFRPIGADPSVQQKTRRVTWLSQYGTTSAKRGQIIGTVTWNVDGHDLQPEPIYAWVTTRRSGALFEKQGPIISGEVIFPKMNFDLKDLELQNSIFELCYLN